MLAAAAIVHIGSPAAGAAAGVTYYVSAAGDDAASGLDEAHAWRSLAKVYETTFQPGDRILLRAGDRWQGQLWPKGSGAAGSPITTDRYGTGGEPGIDGAGTQNAQHAATVLTGRAAGAHTYVAGLTNAAGTTRSTPLTITVRGWPAKSRVRAGSEVQRAPCAARASLNFASHWHASCADKSTHID